MSTNDDLARLAAVIESRKPANGGDPEKSYVARLLHKGPDSFLKKIGEEATEAVMAAKDLDHGGDPQKLVNETAERLQLTPLLHRYPKQLSGGQRQRVAIGRAIVRRPKVFLFDEPLSNLDASLRVQMRIELAKLHADLKTTMIYVTHDQTEAMTLGDRIAVFNQGRIEQVGAPMDLYQSPANTFVAQFLGSPKINLLPYTVDASLSRIQFDS